MNNKLSVVIVVLLLGGLANYRPAQAFFSNQTNLNVILQTADWQSPTTKVIFNNQEVDKLADGSLAGWADCVSQQPFTIADSNSALILESIGPIKCVQKQLVFSQNQLRTVSIKYQLSAAELLIKNAIPLVHFFWNHTEIAWISQTSGETNWITLNIPGTDLAGTFSIKVVGDETLNTSTQLVISEISSCRLLIKTNDELTVRADDPSASILLSVSTTTELLQANQQLSVRGSELPEFGSIQYWSVDAWGNTELPKKIEYQVINQQAQKPLILWQQLRNNHLYILAQTPSSQNHSLVSKYRLEVADGVIEGKLEQPWITAAQAWHQSDTLVGISFPIKTSGHAARLQSVDQVNNVSLASDLITF